jgi:hypothetical protein
MQIQIVAGTALAQQRRVTELLDELGNDRRRTVQAEAYGPAGLIDILEVRSSDGHREILVLNCSRLQIQAVLDWQSCEEDNAQLKSLVLHLVRIPDSNL